MSALTPDSPCTIGEAEQALAALQDQLTHAQRALRAWQYVKTDAEGKLGEICTGRLDEIRLGGWGDRLVEHADRLAAATEDMHVAKRKIPRLGKILGALRQGGDTRRVRKMAKNIGDAVKDIFEYVRQQPKLASEINQKLAELVAAVEGEWDENSAGFSPEASGVLKVIHGAAEEIDSLSKKIRALEGQSPPSPTAERPVKATTQSQPSPPITAVGPTGDVGPVIGGNGPRVPRGIEPTRRARETYPPHKRSIEDVRQEFRRNWPNLEFSDIALEKTRKMDRDRCAPFQAEFGRMNIGDLDTKRSIHGTKPKIFELKAGDKGRIYYRQINQEKWRVELIGGKAEQDRDCEILRKKFSEH